jgi:hypothetical protein
MDFILGTIGQPKDELFPIQRKVRTGSQLQAK